MCRCPSPTFSIDPNQRLTYPWNLYVFPNDRHRHSGIQFDTSARRHTGLALDIASQRSSLYERARQQQPRRWSRAIRD